MTIGDIYAGKPDAGDEIRERGYQEFENSYIEPSEINIERLASAEYGTPIFIMGDKGTGKTALLHFLKNYICKLDAVSCSSFIFFDSGFNHVDREKLNTISRSISTGIAIDNSIASIGENTECDFTYIWKWQLFKKLIADNDAFNGGLFENDVEWSKFVNEINRVDKTIDKGRMSIPAQINITATANPQLGTITSGLNIVPLDLSQRNFNRAKEYSQFVDIINRATSIAKSLKRTNVPYYIFIDELEAYKGEGDTFHRDLRMIRDLLFTVKVMNDIFQSGTKFICSVRPEILQAINRFVQSNQLHKIMQGYDEKLIWEYTNTNSFNHPIIKVLLKRIENAEKRQRTLPSPSGLNLDKWFEARVYNTHVCSYILNNTWHKPRDIVRLLLSAQAKNSKNYSRFNQNAFDTFMPAYSKQCLVEVKEEMRALYKADEIESIFSCMQGYKTKFSFDEISARAKRLCANSTFANDPLSVLTDMYRIGVVGNYLYKEHSPRWAHKEQERILVDDPWKIIIHPALRIELATNVRIDKFVSTVEKHKLRGKKAGTVYVARVKEIKNRYILVSFTNEGDIQTGYIFMNNLNFNTVKEGELELLLKVGDDITVEVIGYPNYLPCCFMRQTN